MILAVLGTGDQLFLTVITGIILSLLGWGGYKAASLIVVSINKMPSEENNDVLRKTMQDYKEASILISQQKKDLNAAVIQLNAELEICQLRNDKLERAMADLVIENLALTHRIEELELKSTKKSRPFF